MNSNESLIEIALKKMRSRKKSRTLARIAKDVFDEKGYTKEEGDKLYTQFCIDFMLSGHFICCGEDENGIKVWDLKSRQPSSLLDKDGNYLEDLYSDDEEVLKNELTDDVAYVQTLDKNFDDETYDEDEEEDDEEHDEIEEELASERVVDEEDVITEKPVVDLEDEDEDDLIEDDFDLDDDK
ncbi:MAG: hypothetical protein PHP65_03285 [Bacilli bacterium]|jgi:DNA-directed RNA polymerase subunit delta|nr:hypothetical protein [Bacilli bacterium]